MADERRPESVADLWRSQTADGFRIAPDEIRRRSEQMDRKLRRTVIDFYLVFALVSIVVFAMALISPSPTQLLGAALTSAGLGWLAREVQKLRAPRDAATPSVDYHRAQLERQLAFAQPPRVWTRMLILAPGAFLLLYGFGKAHPELATMMYIQMAMFAVAFLAAVPASRVMRRKVQQRIDELDRLGS